MLPQTSEQVALRDEDDDALGHRHRVRRLRLIVEYGYVAERASSTEDFQNLFAAFGGDSHRPHAAAEHDAESFGPVALSEDHVARVIAALPQTGRQRLERGLRQ